MWAVDAALCAPVLVSMAAIAVVDARRMIVDPRLVLALMGAGLLWRLFASADTGSLWGAALGAALGMVAVAVPIVLAHWRRCRWPLFPGDAMLLAGLGFVLGPLGLGWSMLAGSACALVHRVWLQRRRGRPFRRGYCPLGPGMVVGAMAVFLFVNAGGSLAADRTGATPPAPLHPGPIEAAAGTVALTATELAPVRVPLPPSLAARAVAIEGREPLSFAALTERIAALAGVPVAVEERPARVAGGAVRLPDPPGVYIAFEGTLADLLNAAAVLTGYDWTWGDGAIVFYRYWDVEHRTPEAGIGVEGAATRGGNAAGPWLVNLERHETLRDVLEDWGARAGWTVVWKPGRNYAVGAGASFAGGFLEAVDGLLAAPATRRSLVAFAHEPNRHLVIENAGAMR